MLSIHRGKVYFVGKYWYLVVVSLALACGFGVLFHMTINGTLLADDRFVVNYGENSEMEATMSIPAIDLVAPVFEVGTDLDNRIEATLVRGNVGWFKRSEAEGLGRLLVGHNPGVFGKLADANLGDTVVFYNEGRVENYEIVDVATKYRDEIAMDDELRSADLLMMTCAGEREGEDFLERLMIYARKL